MILTDPEWQAVILSLKVSSLAVLFSLPFGIFFAWLLVRCKFPGKALLDSVLHLPLMYRRTSTLAWFTSLPLVEKKARTV